MGGDRYDVVIVGAGPAGISAGARAAENGMSHVVLDSASLANTIERYSAGKHVMAEPEALPVWPGLEKWFKAGSREDVLASWQKWVDEKKVKTQIGSQNAVRKIAGGSGEFEVLLAGEQVLKCARVLVATGAGTPNTFSVPGADRQYVTYQLDDPSAFDRKTIVVFGAGDSAIENALDLADNNDVSLVNRGTGFEKARDANEERIEKAIQSGRITHYPQTTIQCFDDGNVVVLSGGLRLEVDRVIARLGATPSRRLLQDAGVRFPGAEGFPELAVGHETNISGLHLIGAAAGFPLIRHCLNQGYEAIEHACGRVGPSVYDGVLAKMLNVPAAGVAEKVRSIQDLVPLLAALSQVQATQFVAGSQIVSKKAGQLIFADDFSDDLYSILSGTVRIQGAGLELPEGRRPQSDCLLGAGEFFGEIGLISGRRRSATALAATDCTLLKTPRKLMVATRKDSTAVRELVDRVFLRRRIRDLVGPDVPAETLEAAASASALETYEQGQKIFAQGDPPNGLHLIRSGSVMVSFKAGDRETPVAYVSAGNLLGEMSLLDENKAHSGTAQAMVNTEIVRIPKESFAPLLARPEVRKVLENVRTERLMKNVLLTAEDRSTDILDSLRRVGAGEATNMLLIDESLCVRCDNCERACAATHGGRSRLDRAAGPTFASIHVPTSCRHCENAKCMEDCPPDALVRLPTGEVHIKDNCIGCGNCEARCPYNVIKLVPRDPPRPSFLDRLAFWRRADHDGAGHQKVAVKCDLCYELPGIKNGTGHTACVASCPTGALVRVDPRDFVAEAAK